MFVVICVLVVLKRLNMVRGKAQCSKLLLLSGQLSLKNKAVSSAHLIKTWCLVQPFQISAALLDLVEGSSEVQDVQERQQN